MTATQVSRPWAGKTLGDAGPYTHSQWDEAWRVLEQLEDRPQAGFLPGFIPLVSTSGADVLATAPDQRDGTKRALAAVFGKLWIMDDGAVGDDGIVTLTPTTPGASTRTDLIVVRADWTAQTIRLALRENTAEGTGSAPSPVQQAGSTYELPLAVYSITTAPASTLLSYEARGVGSIGVAPEVQAIFYDDFIGSLISAGVLHSQHHWDVATTGTASVAVGTAALGGAYGHITLATGATINSTAHVNAPGVIPGQTEFDMRLRVRQNSLAEFEWIAGLSTDTASITPADGIFVRANHGAGAVNLVGVCRKDAAESTLDLGSTGTALKHLVVRAVRELSVVHWYLNENYIGAITTDLPVGGDDLTPNIFCENTTGADKQLSVDVVAVNASAGVGLDPRWTEEI